MKDPMDCTYPHTRLCAHECCEGCQKQQNAQGWRKRQIERRQYEDALAEDEAFALAQKHEGQKLLLTCNQLGVCQERQPACPDCPRKTV